MNLFLDDTRIAPEGYELVTNYEELIEIFKNTNADDIENISLDHDLGTNKTGYDICKWIVENNYWIKNIYIHSANIVGVKNMIQLLDHYAPSFVNIQRISYV